MTRFSARLSVAGKPVGLAAAIGLALLAAAGSVAAAPQSGPLTLAQGGLGGQQAVDAIGTRMGAVASANGRSAAEMTGLLLRDPTLRVDRYGWLYSADDQALVPATLPPPSPPGSLPLDLNATFRLHSLPDAKGKLYLNFQGGTLPGAGWNQPPGQTTTTLAAFDIDGTPGVFSDSERRIIQSVWQLVAEDLAPFKIDVTTDPASAPDDGYVSTMMITRDPGFAAGTTGLSYASNFRSATFGPGLVFHDRLQSNDKFIAEAISHQVGHRLGLDHDGTATLVQYAGHRNWAPIMGQNYAAAVTQFSKGEYAGATNQQDDLAIIARTIGFRSDLGDAPEAATALLEWNGSGRYTRSAAGGIEQPGDVDYYVIAAGAGAITAKLQHQMAGANADLGLALLDDTGRLLRSARLSAASNGTGDILSYPNQRPGTYYLRVSGLGYGDRPATGFSDYGSRGLYSLSVSFPSSGHRPPIASITVSGSDFGITPLSFQLDGRNAGNTGSLRYAWDLGNGTVTGDVAAPSALFSSPGQYRIKLKVVDSAGFSASTSRLAIAGLGLQPPLLTAIVRPIVSLPGTVPQWLIQIVQPPFFTLQGLQLPATATMRFGDPATAAELSSIAAFIIPTPPVIAGILSSSPCITRHLPAVVSDGTYYFPTSDTTLRTCPASP